MINGEALYARRPHTLQDPYIMITLRRRLRRRVRTAAGVVPSRGAVLRGSGHSGPCVSFRADLFATASLSAHSALAAHTDEAARAVGPNAFKEAESHGEKARVDSVVRLGRLGSRR